MPINIKPSLRILSALALLFASNARAANDIEPGKERYTVIRAPGPIVIDGNLSEWGDIPVLADPKFSVPKGSGPAGTGNFVLFEEYAGGTWTGPDDQTSAVQVAYDADNVYFGFVVTDDFHENSALSAWNGDSVQLMIASADRTAQVALYNYALGGVESALGDTIVMHEAGPGGTTAVVKRNTATKRTTYEIMLPKASLGIETLAAGVQFGLGMAINDGDEATPGQRGWGGLGAHALVFGKSPAETALMTLAAPLPPTNDIEPGKESYTVTFAPKPVVVDGVLGEWTGVPVLADPKFSVPKGSGPTGTGTYVLFEEYAGGTWTGPDDQTSAVQVIYDADNVYFGFVVTDDYHENSANSAWNGDSVQLMIASADRTAQVALYNYALGGVEGALLDTIVMHEAGPGGTSAIVTRNSATKRTTYEIKLPKESLGLTELKAGVQFGLGMAINDGDQATPGQRGWGGLGAHAIVFGKTPKETALMTLAAPPTPPTNDIEPGKENYTVKRKPADIVIDGSLSEWVGVPVLADPKFSIPKGSGPAGTGSYVLFEEYAGGTWTGPDDQTSAVQVVYDADNVYFGFVVTDDYHENSANSAWNGDSVQLMIATADRTAQVALYNYALGGVEGALLDTIVMHEAGPGGTSAIVTRNSVTKRTTYEIKLPKESLGLAELKGGVQFGLGMAINDGDQATPGQRGWGGLGAHAIVFGKTPGETALMTLETYNDIEPGKERYTATAAKRGIAIDGSLSEWVGVPVLADPKFSVPKGSGATGTGNYVLFEEYAGGTWTGPDDQTSAVQIVYDAENVYFGFVVTDDYHENSANSAWNGDSVQLMIASADRTAQVALYNYALGGVEGALLDTVILHEAGPGGTTAVVVRDGLNKKTFYEIRLPAASLGLTPPLMVGTQFGLGMAINDGDQATPGQRGWGGLGAHSIVFGKTPSETALITLGTASSGSAVFFLSAINPGINTFTFRASDLGASIVAPSTAILKIDGQTVALVASPKVLDATDFSYVRATPFAPGTHTYSIEIKDSLNQVVTDSGTFIAASVPIMTAGQRGTAIDTTKPGFIWSVFQNEALHVDPLTAAEYLDQAEQVLAGEIADMPNLADPNAIGIALEVGVTAGPLVKFEIPTVLNVNQFADGAAGSADFSPDDQMPGVPGANGLDDGIDAEILTFVELPAGVVTLGITCDDLFRAYAGYLNSPADVSVIGADLGLQNRTTIMKLFVAEAGIYPIRIVYQERTGGAYIEFFSVKADGTKVLVNDIANGGLKAYRKGAVPVKSTIFNLAIARAAGQTSITWTEPGVVLQQSPVLPATTWTDVVGATSPFTPPAGSDKVFYRLKK
jgi:DNA-binding protein Fis